MNGNNYEFVNVDPRVIAAFGGDDESILTESVDDIAPDFVETPAEAKDLVNDNMFIPNFVDNTKTKGESAILAEILKELKEIKIILAGK